MNNKPIVARKNNAKFTNDELVELTIAGNRAELKSSGFKTPKTKMSIRRLKDGRLIDTKTGEYITSRKFTKRIDSLTGIKKSLKDLYWLLSANVHGRKDELFLTLTYRDPFQLDPRKAKKDWRNVYKNHLHRYYPNVKYIAIFEPQGRLYYNRKGEKVPSWHIHVILLGIGSIPKEKLYSWWKFGNISFVNIGEMKKTKGINNLAEYFTSYAKKLDVEFMNEAALRIAKGKGANVLQSLNKQVAKAARLYFYPANFRIYTHSEGLKKAKKKYLLFSDVDQSRIGHPISSSTVIVKDNNGRKLNEYKRVIFERD